MGGPLDPPTTSPMVSAPSDNNPTSTPAGRGSPPYRPPTRRTPPRMRPGRLIVLAVIANLLLATSVAAAVAPVETSREALSFYDALPDWARGLLGDHETENGVQRGFLGEWLHRFHINAVKGSPKAQLEMPLSPTSDIPEDQWVSNSTVTVQWTNHGAPLTYRLQVTDSPEPGQRVEPDVSTQQTNATVEIPPGPSWIHLQASHDSRHGPVATLGPFMSDPEPPPAPELVGAPRMEVDAYQFTLEWSDSFARSGIERYHVERLVSGEWEHLATLDADSENMHTERNRPNGLYTFRVVAESGSGLLSQNHTPLEVKVKAEGSLTPPGTGDFHRGVNAIYDSVLYMWDISDPSRYNTVDEVHTGASGLTQDEVDLYTGPGWGITLDNETLRNIVATELGATWQGDTLVGGERNNLEIGMILFEWMFDAVDYDFEKFEGPNQDLLRANEVLDAGGGICGDLTALYVTLMRIAGVPARPVHGYLINQDGAPDQDFPGIGGFHMWPEIYVGGEAHDPTGDGWIPVDVSGVTGSYSDEKMLFYFGVANPNYLQLGIQKDLGDESLGDDHERNKWNIWANMRYSFAQGSDPTVNFNAGEKLSELEVDMGRLWFTVETKERVYCDGTDGPARPCDNGDHTRFYNNTKGRSVRTIDYGADVGWSGEVHEVFLSLRYPETLGPNQVAMWTAYEKNRDCVAREANPDMDRGYLEWTIPGSERPCI